MTRHLEQIPAPPTPAVALDARIEDDEVDQPVTVPAAEAAGRQAAPARRDIRSLLHLDLLRHQAVQGARHSREAAGGGEVLVYVRGVLRLVSQNREESPPPLPAEKEAGTPGASGLVETDLLRPALAAVSLL